MFYYWVVVLVDDLMFMLFFGCIDIDGMNFIDVVGYFECWYVGCWYVVDEVGDLVVVDWCVDVFCVFYWVSCV